MEQLWTKNWVKICESAQELNLSEITETMKESGQLTDA